MDKEILRLEDQVLKGERLLHFVETKTNLKKVDEHYHKVIRSYFHCTIEVIPVKVTKTRSRNGELCELREVAQHNECTLCHLITDEVDYRDICGYGYCKGCRVLFFKNLSYEDHVTSDIIKKKQMELVQQFEVLELELIKLYNESNKEKLEKLKGKCLINI
jgi:hypothetical protein